MTFHAAPSGEARSQADSSFCLPLVSIIVVNYNYADFIGAAVRSVFGQTYPNLECIVVDNASTDDSASVIEALRATYPAIKLIQRASNDGQSAASVDGYVASTGSYVVFLDADDLLLPTFVETHIQAHLCMRDPIGFSSSDVFQSSGTDIVLGTFSYFTNAIDTAKLVPARMRPLDSLDPTIWTLPRSQTQPKPAVYAVPAFDLTNWVWSPTSGNCFRRDALELFMHNSDLPHLRYSFDGYLLRAVHGMCGSILIDMPLTVYRIHNKNIFTRHPHLNGVVAFSRGNTNQQECTSREIIINHVLRNMPIFLEKANYHGHLLQMLKTLDRIYPALKTADGREDYLFAKIREARATTKKADERAIFTHWWLLCSPLKRHGERLVRSLWKRGAPKQTAAAAPETLSWK